MCTFLHHSDPTIPHYRKEEWSFLRGATATVDRPILGWIGRFFFHNVRPSVPPSLSRLRCISDLLVCFDVCVRVLISRRLYDRSRMTTLRTIYSLMRLSVSVFHYLCALDDLSDARGNKITSRRLPMPFDLFSWKIITTIPRCVLLLASAPRLSIPSSDLFD